MLWSSSPLLIVKPGVVVANVTDPINPEAAPSVLVKSALSLVLVKPEVGGPWSRVSAVTLSE